MPAIIAIILFATFLIFFFPIKFKKAQKEEKSPKYTAQMKKLWEVAQTSMRERKPLRAEKALLTILKFDERNAAAYNRLGILYAKSQKFDEAVECFEIAQSLDSNPSSIHNAGLIYLETGAYEKAIMAFQQAIEIEGDVPSRYIALAKAEEKIGNKKAAIEALENAYELDRSINTLRQILAINEAAKDEAAITETTARIEAQIAEDAAKKEQEKKQLERRKILLARKTAASKMPTKVAPAAAATAVKSASTTAKPATMTTAAAPAKPATSATAAKPAGATTSPARPKTALIKRRKII